MSDFVMPPANWGFAVLTAEHSGVAAISFVGSTPLARLVYEIGTSHGKRVQALGGAKNHMVVSPDADLDAGVAAGAELVADGREQTVQGEGFWLGPSLLDHVTPEMSVYVEEIFGPVRSVVRVDTFEEASALVNANPYGNGTAIFTADGGRRGSTNAESRSE